MATLQGYDSSVHKENACKDCQKLVPKTFEKAGGVTATWPRAVCPNCWKARHNTQALRHYHNKQKAAAAPVAAAPPGTTTSGGVAGSVADGAAPSAAPTPPTAQDATAPEPTPQSEELPAQAQEQPAAEPAAVEQEQEQGGSPAGSDGGTASQQAAAALGIVTLHVSPVLSPPDDEDSLCWWVPYDAYRPPGPFGPLCTTPATHPAQTATRAREF